ncbi:MAG: hypothetical protein HY033_13450 [Ignavibacteriae bacterium]|nr:hypothetical protein [Ignavibacteriota bacterium]
MMENLLNALLSTTDGELENLIIGEIKKRIRPEAQLAIAYIFIKALCQIRVSSLRTLEGLRQQVNLLSDQAKLLQKIKLPDFNPLFERLKKELEYGEKFKGKKVSKENENLYKEIDEVHRKMTEEFGDLGFKPASDKVAKLHRKNAQNLYARYMKWRNSRYVKSI